MAREVGRMSEENAITIQKREHQKIGGTQQGQPQKKGQDTD